MYASFAACARLAEADEARPTIAGA